MTRITFSELMTIIFVLADDWYQAYGQAYLQEPDSFSDQEFLQSNFQIHLLSKY